MRQRHHHHDDERTDDEGPWGRRFGLRHRAAAGGSGPPWWGMGPGFGGPWGGGRGRGRGRARRGDVRAALLALLAERPMHGYEMIGELEERTGGAWKPSPGSVYPTLQLLEDEGLVTSEELDGKRRFALTDAGREAADGREGAAPWEELARDHADRGELWAGVGQLVGAARQVAVAGTDEQQRRAAEVVADARRQLYAILAEG